jgi:nicotinamidase-related amidase
MSPVRGGTQIASLPSIGHALEDHLRSLRVTTLAFTGCNCPNCPRTSIDEASERDFRVVFVDDAISGVYERGKVNSGISV